jgi:CheY-like chemotaxis protein
MIVERGFAGHLMKPVMLRDLTGCLHQVLSDGALRPSEPAADTSPAAPLHCAYRLLLAEDNVINRKVAQRLLERLGYEVDLVSDGRAAVDAWQAGQYDLILMDCQMPEMDGYEATREIRRRENGARRIPIVALTAHAMKGADAECLAAGMDDYLTKPIDANALRVCLERYLSPQDGTRSVA